VLPARDAAQVQTAGTIGITEWIDKVKSGDPQGRLKGNRTG
jgi:hypothetical protein